MPPRSPDRTLERKPDCTHCTRCKRLQRQFKVLRESHPDYWNKPVPPSGPEGARLLIVGLAPGMHGANRSGRPFTGDASGELLFKALNRFDLQDAVRITNAVKCVPVSNLPTTTEIDNCRRFLVSELAMHKTALILGGVAHRAVLKALDATQARFPFAHGAVHKVAGKAVIDSYHPSRYNTQTGRLTEPMFTAVVELAAGYAGFNPTE